MDLFGFRKKHPHKGVCHLRGRVRWPWNVVWLVFENWVILHANEWEDHSNNWGTTHSLAFWHCLGTVLVSLGVSFSLYIENQCLVEFDLSVSLDPFYFSWFILCPWAMAFFQKLCPTPSLLFHALFLSPVWAHNVASTIFWRDNQKIAGSWEGNTV